MIFMKSTVRPTFRVSAIRRMPLAGARRDIAAEARVTHQLRAYIQIPVSFEPPSCQPFPFPFLPFPSALPRSHVNKWPTANHHSRRSSALRSLRPFPVLSSNSTLSSVSIVSFSPKHSRLSLIKFALYYPRRCIIVCWLYIDRNSVRYTGNASFAAGKSRDFQTGSPVRRTRPHEFL